MIMGSGNVTALNILKIYSYSCNLPRGCFRFHNSIAQDDPSTIPFNFIAAGRIFPSRGSIVLSA